RRRPTLTCRSCSRCSTTPTGPRRRWSRPVSERSRPGARRRVAACLLAAGLATAAAAKDMPAWLEAARGTASPAPSATGPAHRLLHERHVTCATKGRNVIVDRGAVRLLDRQASAEARVAIAYDRGSARVRDLQAWLVTADGRVTQLGAGQAVDVSLAQWGSLKTDQRARGLVAAGAAAGGGFGRGGAGGGGPPFPPPLFPL